MNASKSRHYLSLVQDESLAEHDKRFHPNGYDPKTMTCEFRERRAAIDPVDGDIDEERGISGIYTGSSASYARPSLLHIGSGEGAQVYGFGLYGSNQRGVGEHYADIAVKAGNIRTTQNILPEKIDLNVNGHETNEKEFGEMCAAHGFAHAFIALSECGYDYEGAINRMRKEMRTNREGTPMHEEAKRGFKWLNDTYGKIKLTGGKSDKHLYEQTFFANRSKGDESHLINWYEKISDENISRIREQARKEGLNIKNFEDGLKPRINPRAGRSHGAYDKGEDVYMSLVDDFDGSAKKASEFLARADIDGIKYPVDSYGGKTIKDGDKAGWNYVSFRDDNIRINRKFVNGEEVAVKDEAKGRLRKIAQDVMDELNPVGGFAEHKKNCKAKLRCPFDRDIGVKSMIDVLKGFVPWVNVRDVDQRDVADAFVANAGSGSVRYMSVEDTSLAHRRSATLAMSGEDLKKLKFTVVHLPEPEGLSTEDVISRCVKSGVVGQMDNDETRGKGRINISLGSIREMLNGSQVKKSVSASAHRAVVLNLRRVLGDAETVENHPDRKKVNGVRDSNACADNGISIDVLYAAVKVGDDDVMRCKIRVKRYQDASVKDKAYSYDVKTIEVEPGHLAEQSAIDKPNPRGSTSVCGDSILKGVEDFNGRELLSRGRGIVSPQIRSIAGYYDRNSGDICLVRGVATAETVAHEIGWHMSLMWAKKNHRKLYEKLIQYAREAPEGIVQSVMAKYAGLSLSAEALIDEIGAERFTREDISPLLEEASRRVAEGWFDDVESAQNDARNEFVKDRIKDTDFLSKGEVDRIAAMTPKRAVEELVNTMLSGKSLRMSLKSIAQDVMDELYREPVDGMAEHRKHCEAQQGDKE